MDIAETPKEEPAPEADKPADEPLPGERRTRLSGAWTAIVIGLLALVVILVFILQNQQSVQIKFLMFEGNLPVAIALLFALILGAVIVFAFGAARILQLRMVAGRARPRVPSSRPPAECPARGARLPRRRRHAQAGPRASRRPPTPRSPTRRPPSRPA